MPLNLFPTLPPLAVENLRGEKFTLGLIAMGVITIQGAIWGAMR